MALRGSRHRSSRRSHPRGLIVGALIGGFTCVLLVVSSALFAPAEVSDGQAARDAVDVSEGTPDASASGDPGAGPLSYPYSVVPGGVHSTAALADAVRDPVVASHYASIDIAHARIERVPAPRRAYVSYRIGSQVFWTRHTVALREGEAILTDGAHQIRARCGNRISDTPQEPTQAGEPDVAEFDRALPPVPASAPMLMTPIGTIAGGAPAAPLSAIGDLRQGAPVVGFPGLPVGEGGIHSNGAPDGPDPAEWTSGGYNLPGGGVPIARDGGSSLDGDGSAITPFDEPTFGSAGGEPVLTPVPEPDSLILLASGLAGCALHAWRRRRRP